MKQRALVGGVVGPCLVVLALGGCERGGGGAKAMPPKASAPVAKVDAWTEPDSAVAMTGAATAGPGATTTGTAPAALPAEVAALVERAEAYLGAREGWSTARRALLAPDHDVAWDDLDPMQQEQYVEAMQDSAGVATAVVAALSAAGVADRGKALGRTVAPVTRYLAGRRGDPTGRVSSQVDAVLDAARDGLVALAAAGSPGEACVGRRLVVAEALREHRAALDAALVDAEVEPMESGLPRGSPEWQEAVDEASARTDALTRWRAEIDRGAAPRAADLRPAPVPALVAPPGPMPDELTATWRDLSAAVTAARGACPR